MGEPNGIVRIRIDNKFDINGTTTGCGQTTGPTGQREAIERLQYNRQYNGNNLTINGCESSGYSGSTPLPPTRTTRSKRTGTTVSTKPRDRDREPEKWLYCNGSTKTTALSSTTRLAANASQASRSCSAGIVGNAIGNGLQVGRGRHWHRLQHNTTTTRADHYSSVGTSLAAPVVPVSQTLSDCVSNSAFDNKAFSCDGDRPELSNSPNHSFHNPLSTDNARLNSSNTTTNTTTNHTEDICAISDGLITADNSNLIPSVDSNNRKNSNFMVTRNDSDSALKGRYCSSGDDHHPIRARSTRSTRSTRSSVVKHIGVFYSDLCDVIKAMRSGTNSGITHNTTNNINNNCNINTNIGSTHPTPQTSTTSAAANSRPNISAPVLLHNEHVVNASVPVPQPSQSHQCQPYPIQPQPQPIPCLQLNPMPVNLMSGQSTLRSSSQTQIRLNENQVHDLPDILNSHLPPPPYSTLPPPHLQLPPLSSLPPLAPIRAPPPPPPPPPLPTGRPPLPSRRILHTPSGALGHCSRPNYLRPTCAVSETETSASKTCLSCNGVSIRWFILLIAFIGLLCSIVGTILGALRTTGREHLTLALLMIGVGIILITVSGIAWRLTSTGPTWRSILGLHELHQQQSLCNGSSINEASRRFVPRVPAPYGRTGTHHHPYGAMFYPEFQYRPPPPSYQASMQEYRLRLLLLDRSSSHPQSTSLSPVSPPPTYRSSAASSLTGTLPRQSQVRNTANHTIQPPNYGQPIVSTSTQTAAQSRQTNTGISSAVSTTLTTTTSQTQTQQSIDLTPNPLKLLSQKPSHHSSHHDINRVTILQTTNTSQVCTPNGVNIVAISPTSIMAANTPTTTTIPNLSAPVVSSNEVQILAHV